MVGNLALAGSFGGVVGTPFPVDLDEDTAGFGNVFDVRFHGEFASGIQSPLKASFGTSHGEIDDDDSARRTRETMAIIELLGEGLSGDAWDRVVLFAWGDHKICLGDVKRATENVVQNYSRSVDEAQRAGVVSRNMSERRRDEVQNELEALDRTLDSARDNGTGIPDDIIINLSPEAQGILQHQLRQAMPSLNPGLSDTDVEPGGMRAAPGLN
jgi:hypothetical protein